MVRGRTTAPHGLILGHEITGEVIEAGRDVEFIKVGDLFSVPFNIACGRCRNCKEGKTGICLNVNPARPGAAYGYVDMGGWVSWRGVCRDQHIDHFVQEHSQADGAGNLRGAKMWR
jgi:glutathione-independent formaldehyde dehydrogenase